MAIRSRVTPGMSCTMLIRFSTSALSRLLFPTLGRPTIATVGGNGMLVLWREGGGLAICLGAPPQAPKFIAFVPPADGHKTRTGRIKFARPTALWQPAWRSGRTAAEPYPPAGRDILTP